MALPLRLVEPGSVGEGGFEALEGVGQDCDLGLEALLKCDVRVQVASAPSM